MIDQVENEFEDLVRDGPNYEVDYLFNQVKDMSDLYFISVLVLSKLENSKKHGLLAELSYLLDNQSFTNLLWYFEGQTIRIPTREELKEVLQLMLIYYHFNILGKKWRTALEDSGIPYDRNLYRRMRNRYRKFLEELEGVRLPESMRGMKEDD